MVLNLERFDLEDLAARNTTRILRLMVLKPYFSWGLTELSKELDVSKSNVSRILKILLAGNLIYGQKSGRKKIYRINYEMGLVKTFWNLFMNEKILNLRPEFKNAVDLLYDQVKDDVELFILFGSVAQGLATEKSDIDIVVVTRTHLDVKKFDFLPYRFEIHEYTMEDVQEPVDFVVLDALLNGIIFKGDVFKVIAELNSFPKPYIVYRLEKAKEFLNKASTLEGEARKYYEDVAEITIGEIQSVIYHGVTIPKRETKVDEIHEMIKNIEKDVSRQGERIWLT